jgi:hypothetical protein
MDEKKRAEAQETREKVASNVWARLLQRLRLRALEAHPSLHAAAAAVVAEARARRAVEDLRSSAAAVQSPAGAAVDRALGVIKRALHSNAAAAAAASASAQQQPPGVQAGAAAAAAAAAPAPKWWWRWSQCGRGGRRHRTGGDDDDDDSHGRVRERVTSARVCAIATAVEQGVFNEIVDSLNGTAQVRGGWLCRALQCAYRCVCCVCCCCC